MSRATSLGWSHGNEEWANFGQGAPEVGPIPGAKDRPTSISWDVDDNEYGPVAGDRPMREAVANLYNTRYRQGMDSQYTYENVCITPGGRSSLARLAASLGNVYLGHFLPDYSAYEEMLSVFKKFVPIPQILDPQNGYSIKTEDLQKEIRNKGLSVVLISNPSNPTGRVIEGEELESWVDLARQSQCSFIIDEFYSSYIYTHDPVENGRTVSAAEYIHDVNADPIIIVDGLTKNWRLPGWRIAWTVGPKDVIRSLASAGSFLEGGANHPMQLASLPLLNPEWAYEDSRALQTHFRAKRDYVIGRLKEMGIRVDIEPCGTFYIWANLEELPAPLNNGLSFFEALLKYKTIVVPGIFFDVNPSKRRDLFHSPCHHFIRISFGPSMDVLTRGLDNMEKMIRDKKKILPNGSSSE
jgi:aspartate/methionine/tyrosine aminotransferase